MKVLKNLFRILILAIPLCILLHSNSFAMTQEEAGNYIANWAIDFYNKHAGDVHYNTDDESRAYCIRSVEPWPDTGAYELDCVGFVNMVVVQSTGLPGDQFRYAPITAVVWPSNQSGEAVEDDGNFERVTGELQRGDILRNSHHVMVYVGNGMIIHCDGGGTVGLCGLSYETPEQYEEKNGSGYNIPCYTDAYRLRADVVENLQGTGDSGNRGMIGGIANGIQSAIDGITGFFGELTNENEVFPEGTALSDEEYNKLYYKGIATLKGSKKTEEAKTDDWSFPSLSDMADWITGFLILPIRAAITGWANIVQIVVSEYINAATGEQVTDVTEIMKDMSSYMKKTITLEKIVYNEVPIFDANVFEGNSAGGQQVSKDSLVAIIRSLVANWYYAFRLVAIIGLLVILIYIGIKGTISTVAEEKARYKSMFVNWLVAFVIVFFMQYFMILVMQINQALIDIFKSIGKSLNLYETVRELTWSIKMSTGVLATCLYVMLVYYMIKFAIMYFKRLFIIVLLIILAPLIAAKYAIDRLNGSKSSGSLTIWTQEYTFNVMMQTIHALTYTIFTAVSVDITKATTNANNGESYIFATILITILFFRFMVESEQILKNMMKMMTGPGADFGDANTTSFKELFGVPLLLQLSREIKPLKIIFGKNPTKDMRESYLGRKIAMPFRKASNYVKDSYVLYNTERYKAHLAKTGVIDVGTLHGHSKDLMDLDNQIRQIYLDDLAAKKEMIKDEIGTGVNVVWGMGKAFIGFPVMLAESGRLGAELILVGARTVRVAVGKPITGYKKPNGTKRFYSPVSRGTYHMMNFMSANAIGIARSINERYDSAQIFHQEKLGQVEDFYKAKAVESNMAGQLDELQKTEFKGYQEGATPLEEQMAQIHENQLLQNIMESQKTIPEADIENAVKSYQKQTGKYILGTNDLDQISNMLAREGTREDKSDEIRIGNQFHENIRAQVMSSILKNAKGQDSGYSNLELSQENLQNMSDQIKTKLQTLEQKENKTQEEINQENTLKVAYCVIMQKQQTKEETAETLSEELQEAVKPTNAKQAKKPAYSSEIDASIREKAQQLAAGNVEPEGTQKNTTKEVLDSVQAGDSSRISVDDLNETDRNDVNKAILDSMNENIVEEQVSKFDVKDITKLMKKASKMKGSIEKQEVPSQYEEIVSNAEKLRDLNEESEEKYGKGIFTQEELIKSIQKRIRKKKDD